MALSKFNTVVANIQALADKVTGQASTIKQKFDKAGTDIKTYVNDVLTVEIDTKNDAQDLALETHKSSSDHDGRYYTETEADTLLLAKANDNAVVHLTGNETVAGVKTFSSSPVVPTPTNATDASTKGYVDSSIGAVVLGQIPDDTLTDAKLKQTGDNILPNFIAHIQDYTKHAGFGVTAGTNTAYTLTLNPAPTAYADGMKISIVPHSTCGANPRINVNGLGQKSLYTTSKNGYSGVVSGELNIYSVYDFVYVLAVGAFLLVNVSLLYDHMNDKANHVPYGGTTTNTGNNYVLAYTGIGVLTAGIAVCFKCNADSSGASTINVNALGAKSIKKADGNNVTNLKNGGIYTLRYDGTNFILQGEGASGNATASDLLSGKTATVDAGEIVGNIPDRGWFNLGLGQSVPYGYYTGGTVPSGKRIAAFNVSVNRDISNPLFISGLAFAPSLILICPVGNALSETVIRANSYFNLSTDTTYGANYNAGTYYSVSFGASSFSMYYKPGNAGANPTNFNVIAIE